MSKKVKLGISMGDPNGIGIEIILKIFEDKRMFDFFIHHFINKLIKKQLQKSKKSIFLSE